LGPLVAIGVSFWNLELPSPPPLRLPTVQAPHVLRLPLQVRCPTNLRLVGCSSDLPLGGTGNQPEEERKAVSAPHPAAGSSFSFSIYALFGWILLADFWLG